LMRDLADYGLLERTDRGYILGTRLVALAHRASDPSNLVEVASPIMRELRDVTGETISLHMRAGDQRICVGEVQSWHQVRRVVPHGFSVPLHLGATGEVLLAGLSETERDAYIRRLQLPESDKEVLRVRLEEIAVVNWAMKADSYEQGLSG